MQERLRPRRLDSVFVGAAAGAIAGGAVTLGMTLPVALEASGIRIWMFVAAVLMGLLYWRLAIRPSRQKRLRMARDRAAIRAME